MGGTQWLLTHNSAKHRAKDFGQGLNEPQIVVGDLIETEQN